MCSRTRISYELSLSSVACSDAHFGLGGGTHMWQVIDDGIGYDTKREMGEILDEEPSMDEFYEEWAAGVMPVWRVRVLMTKSVGEAWDRVTARLDAEAVLKKKG